MKIPASEFKTHCLQLMDRVKLQREEIVITKHGKPVAKLVPTDEQSMPVLGFLQDTVNIKANIIKSLDEPWEANG